jgi:hypothetical protein
MQKLVRVLVVLGFLTAVPPDSARAATISFEAVDLADVSLGSDLWSYRYFLSGTPLGINEGFAIFFDRLLYSALSPTNAPTGWDVLVFQPDPNLPSDGIYDALNVAGAPPPLFFEISFIWHGGATAPGAQTYELYALDAAGLYSALGTGTTLPAQVPEPASLRLTCCGLAGLLTASRAVASKRERHRARLHSSKS